MITLNANSKSRGVDVPGDAAALDSTMRACFVHSGGALDLPDRQ